MTRSEENYLKAIFHLGHNGKEAVATNAIAEQLDTKASSVTDMVKKLAAKELVNYVKYQGVSLTDQGLLTALSVIRKHRLWEVFLVEKLDFNWDEVHEVAEQLEHIKSEKLIDRLDTLLGHPKFDPHGDPIPNKKGEYHERKQLLLVQAPIGIPGVCVGVKDSSATFLKYLDRNKIALGNTITILEKEEFDGSLVIELSDRSIRVSSQIASNLYIKFD